MDYSSVQSRVESFRINGWALDFMNPEDLAAAGFYYRGIEDIVQCFACNGKLWRWHAGDDPMADHRRHYAHCSFVRGILLPSSSIQRQSQDVCGIYMENSPQNPNNNVEQQETSNRIVCKICYDEEMTLMFIPCNHIICGFECGYRLQTCPICNSRIRVRERVYFA